MDLHIIVGRQTRVRRTPGEQKQSCLYPSLCLCLSKHIIQIMVCAPMFRWQTLVIQEYTEKQEEGLSFDGRQRQRKAPKAGRIEYYLYFFSSVNHLISDRKTCLPFVRHVLQMRWIEFHGPLRITYVSGHTQCFCDDLCFGYRWNKSSQQDLTARLSVSEEISK